MRAGVLSHLLIVLFLSPLSLTAQTWQSLILRADSLFRQDYPDTTAVLSLLRMSEMDTLPGTGVKNPIGEILWIEGVITDIDEAATLLKRSLEIRESLLGPLHVDIAQSLLRLGMVYSMVYRLQECKQIFTRAIRILEDTYGPYHKDIGIGYHCLGFVHRYAGEYPEARRFLERAIEVKIKALGPDDGEVSFGYAGLGHLLLDLGRYAEAESLYLAAYRIHRASHGQADRTTISCLLALFDASVALGRYERATEIIDKAEESADLWFCRTDLSIAVGDVGVAESLIVRGIRSWMPLYGDDNPSIAHWQVRLAEVFASEGKLAQAESLYTHALTTQRHVLGRSHHAVLATMSQLAGVELLLRETARAESTIAEAFENINGTLAPGHPLMATLYETRGSVLYAQGHHAQACDDFAQSFRIRSCHFSYTSAVVPERDALNLARLVRRTAGMLLSAFLECSRPDSLLVRQVAAALLSTKGVITEAMLNRNRALWSDTSAVSVSSRKRYASTRALLLSMYLHPLSHLSERTQRMMLDSLDEEVRAMEASFARRTRAMVPANDISVDALLKALPESGAVVEYYKYPHFIAGSSAPVEHLLALVVSPDTVCFRDLGPADPIESAVIRFRHTLVPTRGIPRRTDARRFFGASRQLFALAWHPLQEVLAPSAMILVAPDGALCLVPFGTLVDDSSRFLIEGHALQYLSAARDLLNIVGDSPGRSGFVAFGDPDFDAPASERLTLGAAIGIPGTVEAQSGITRNLRSVCGAVPEDQIEGIPGSREEVDLIAAFRKKNHLPCEVYTGPLASEEVFKRCAPGKGIIHLATHGYFVGGECLPTAARGEGTVGENPLLQSGLFLAGANLRGQGLRDPRAEDGILTAYEVSSMNLHGTRLVVLSACETGLGRVEQGEGVYGLRRAFQVAGARTVISALWKISDTETAAYMREIYARQSGSYAGILRQASLKRIRELRARKRPEHPYSWGAFVATGEWKVNP